MRSENINEIALALSKAQAKFTRIAYDKNNPHFKSRYASLDTIIDETRDILAEHGLSIFSMPEEVGGKLCLEVSVMHVSGQYIGCRLPLGVDGSKPQALGSALTYMRRYGIACLLNLATGEDDDAESATNREPEVKKITDAQIDAIKKLRSSKPELVNELNAMIKSKVEACKIAAVQEMSTADANELIRSMVAHIQSTGGE